MQTGIRMNANYKIVSKDSDGTALGEFERFADLQFGKRLNNYGQCSFKVPVTDSKIASLISLRRYTVEVYRGSDLVWTGEQATRVGDLTDKGDNWVTIYCYDWFEQLGSRYTDAEVVFTGIDAGEIAWALIDTTQVQANGDFGITAGTIEATQDRDRIYNDKNIAEAIIELSNVIGGFDFEINHSKVFNISNRLGVDRSGTVILEYGINVKSVSITEDFSKVINRALVLGNNGVPADALRVTREDLDSQGLYKLREAISNEMTVSETKTLEDKGDAILRKYTLPLVKLTLSLVRKTPTILDFALGDTIRLIIKSGIYDIDRQFRVFEWSNTVNADNTESLSLTLGEFTL